MRTEPKFYQNTEDDNHCLQASVMMVLNTLGNPVSWNEINNITKYEDSLYSWSSVAVIILAERIPGTKLISEFDYKKFAIRGENYLKKIWSNNVRWFNKQKKMASPGFQREQNFAKELIEKNLFEEGNTSKREIELLLKNNLIIALVNSRKLAGKDGVAGHFVVVYDEDDNNFLLHDPGLPPKKGWIVNKDSFIEAFKNEVIVIPSHGK